MTCLVLDHPWALEETLDPWAPGHGVLEQFLLFCNARGMKPACFVDNHQCDRLYQAGGQPQVDLRYWRLLAYQASLLVFTGTTTEEAAPLDGPPDLTGTWKRALRHELGDLSDWRTPQIMVPRSRDTDWPSHDSVQLELTDQPAGTPIGRVLVRIDTYDRHPHACPDFDPWDVRNSTATPPVGERNHQCCLPRPPSLVGVSLGDLTARLPTTRQAGWQDGNRRFYIPPASWNPESVPQTRWRGGRAFPFGSTADGRHRGYVDGNGFIWEWHKEEQQWDVQMLDGQYVRVSHTGLLL